MKIKGKVTDTNNNPITGANIEILLNATSDFNGEYIIMYDVKNVTIQATATGYKPNIEIISLLPDQQYQSLVLENLPDSGDE